MAGDDRDIPFEPDFVLEDDETGQMLSGYVAGRGEPRLRRDHYLYHVGVIIRRRGTETSPTRYASSPFLRETDDEVTSRRPGKSGRT